MIDTDNLIGNEESITANASIITAPKKITNRSSNIFIRLLKRFISKKAKDVKRKSVPFQEQRMAHAILKGNINIVYDNHVIKVKILGNKMLPKEFVSFIGKHTDLLLKLHFKIYYAPYFNHLYKLSVVETIRKAQRICSNKIACEIIMIKLITSNFDCFLKSLLDNDNLIELLQKKQFLYNLLILYNYKMDIRDTNSKDWSLVMQKFTPIMLTKCYYLYDKFDLNVCIIIDVLALIINFRQASLFTSIGVYSIVGQDDKQVEKFISKQSVMMYEIDYIEDLFHAGDLLYFNRNSGFQGVHKCCSKNDIVWTIDYLKAYFDINKKNVKFDIKNIRLNGYRQFIENYQKIGDPFIQKMCKILLTAQD